ncbi:hypothetical protein ABZ783_23265 [Micromonospora sp. NPDC047738]|uniref:hypothetical protein n=1 Tax=Micromonospora sp. NPDC047738 TaxID=3155741 RepID=UPI0033C04E01
MADEVPPHPADHPGQGEHQHQVDEQFQKVGLPHVLATLQQLLTLSTAFPQSHTAHRRRTPPRHTGGWTSYTRRDASDKATQAGITVHPVN